MFQKDKSETEKQVLANREKEKGNESFQTGNYSEALMYYCRSIELNPKAAAVYNNRALAGTCTMTLTMHMKCW